MRQNKNGTDDSFSRDYDFKELDAEEKNSGWLLPVLILSFSVLLMSFLIVFLGTRHGAEIEFTNMIGDAEEEAWEEAESDLSVILPKEEDDELFCEDGESAGDPEPPDLNLLEEALFPWLVERVNDPELVLLHKSALEDTEAFIEQQSTGVTILIYEIESAEDTFAVVLLGYPFTEWSVRATFIWKNNRWDFLREESVY